MTKIEFRRRRQITLMWRLAGAEPNAGSFQTWAIYKGADYRTGKSTASARGNRYCNWRVVLIEWHVDLYVA
jgi:hypothetical protein